MAVDTHAHLWRNPRGLDAVVESDKIEQVWVMEVPYFREGPMKELASAREILEVSRRYPGFFVPFGFIDFTKGPEQVDRMKEQGFVGLKAICPVRPYDDTTYFPIYERAEALNMPILFHVGIILKSTREEVTPNQSLGPTNMRPSMLDGIAAAFPRLTLIAGHMGFPWLEELFESLYYYPRIYCSLCGYVDYRWLIDHLDRRCGAGNDPAETLCDRMLFATDCAYGREEPGLTPESAGLSSESLVDFFEGFFRHVGRSYTWGAKSDTVLRGTPRRIMAEARQSRG